MNKTIPVVISLTTTHNRINTLYKTIDTIVNGTKLPEKIILYISKDKYLLDDGITNIPENLNKFDSILEIKWVKNIGPHRKYYYSFNDYRHNLILTIDDDMYYPSNFLEVMYNSYLENSNYIIGGHGKIINEGHYTKWTKPEIGYHKYNYIFCGNPGTLFNTNLIPREQYDNMLDLKLIMKLSPSSSEMWLNGFFRYFNIKIYMIDKSKFNSSFPFKTIENSQNNSLMKYHKTNNWEKKFKIYSNIKQYFNNLNNNIN